MCRSLRRGETEGAGGGDGGGGGEGDGGERENNITGRSLPLFSFLFSQNGDRRAVDHVIGYNFKSYSFFSPIFFCGPRNLTLPSQPERHRRASQSNCTKSSR